MGFATIIRLVRQDRLAGPVFELCPLKWGVAPSQEKSARAGEPGNMASTRLVGFLLRRRALAGEMALERKTNV